MLYTFFAAAGLFDLADQVCSSDLGHPHTHFTTPGGRDQIVGKVW
jgi:hypothetical protein